MRNAFFFFKICFYAVVEARLPDRRSFLLNGGNAVGDYIAEMRRKYYRLAFFRRSVLFKKFVRFSFFRLYLCGTVHIQVVSGSRLQASCTAAVHSRMYRLPADSFIFTGKAVICKQRRLFLFLFRPFRIFSASAVVKRQNLFGTGLRFANTFTSYLRELSGNVLNEFRFCKSHSCGRLFVPRLNKFVDIAQSRRFILKPLDTEYS